MTTFLFALERRNKGQLLMARLKRFRDRLQRIRAKIDSMIGPRSLLRHLDFLKLWSAETFSVFGVQFSSLAIPWIAVKTLKADSFEMGLLGALPTVPFLVFGLFVGVWADRSRRRPIMVMSDVGRALSLVTIPLAALWGGPNLILLYLVSFSVGTFTVFDDVSSYAYLPSLVDEDQLVEGNSRMETSRASAQVAGPSIAGILIQILTAPVTIIADVVGYCGSAGFLSWIRKKESQVKRRKDASVVKDIREGLDVVFKNRYLWAIAGSTGTSNFFSSAIGALLILFVVNELGMNSTELGIIYTLGSVGALIGAVVASRLAKRLGLGRTIVLSIFVGGLSWIAVFFANPSLGIPLLILATFLGSMGSVIYNVNQVSFRQAIVPVEAQGRLNATMRFLVWGTIPIGSIVGGVLGTVLGLRAGIGIAAVGGSLAFLWVLLSPVRQITKMPSRQGGIT
jgi:MFS family permease